MGEELGDEVSGTFPYGDSDPSEPIVGYKWAMVRLSAPGEYRFCGMAKGMACYDVDSVAVCLRGASHRAPKRNCSCGFWACYSPELLAGQPGTVGHETSEVASLTVELTGQCELHEKLARGERQKVLAVQFADRCACGATAVRIRGCKVGDNLSAACEQCCATSGYPSLTRAELAGKLGTEVTFGASTYDPGAPPVIVRPMVVVNPAVQMMWMLGVSVLIVLTTYMALTGWPLNTPGPGRPVPVKALSGALAKGEVSGVSALRAPIGNGTKQPFYATPITAPGGAVSGLAAWTYWAGGTCVLMVSPTLPAHTISLVESLGDTLSPVSGKSLAVSPLPEHPGSAPIAVATTDQSIAECDSSGELVMSDLARYSVKG